MFKSFSRRFGALFLLLSVWMSLVAVFPASLSAQTTDNQKDDKNNKQTKTTQNNNGLSAKEDPSMIGKRNINSGTDRFFGWLGGSKEKEAAIGRQLAMEVEQQSKLVEDPIITEYVNRVGQNIVLHSDAKVPFTIKVIDTDEVNAFALPGGYFYVNRGLILAADNESELAGVMAHEIAHVAARHAMENQGKGQLINWGILGGIIFGGGIASTVLQNAGGFGQLLAGLKFTRGAEEEADRLGVQYLYASGYDPTAMATMFEKLASQNKKKPGSFAKLFTTHPQATDRRDSSLALVARFPEKEEYVISTSEFQRIKARLMKTTNARASTTIDFDEGTPGKPTLKRRTPDSDDPNSNGTGTGTSTSSDKQEGPPQLKRKTEATPLPTPTPEN
ncbi:MAG: M48 family metalloprotease [Pyrinomonadaceae bacterium]|nr:M48 family metalloprotease [Pyrinomonadaceae bacterium]